MRKIEMNFDEVFSQLKSWENESRKTYNAKNNSGDNQFGVMMGHLRGLAKKLKINHSLALELWESGNVDAMILSTMIMDSNELSKEDINKMIEPITYTGILDEFVYNVAAKSSYNDDLYKDWISSKDEYIGRAGWCLIISKLLSGNYESLELEQLIEIIENEMKLAPKNKQFAMNRSLVEIGSRIPKYTEKCIKVGEKVGKLDDKPTPKGCTSSYAPEWIAVAIKKNEKITTTSRIKNEDKKKSDDTLNIDLETVMDKLKELGSEQIKNVLMKHGIQEPFYGTKIGDLKKLVKYVKKNDVLAKELYNTYNYDAMYLAGLSINPKNMTKEELEGWLEKAYCNSIAVCIVANVTAESKFALELARKWIKSEDEIIACCGWSTMGNYISITEDELIDINEINYLLNFIESDIHSSKNRVRYNMNAFVISVGGYIKELNGRALEVAKNIGKVKVSMGTTSCKVPVAEEYIQKIISMNRVGHKKKTCIC